MPELPEVETVRWRLCEGGHGERPLVDRRFVAVEVLDAAVVRRGDLNDIVGARVADVTRRAKWLTLHTDGRFRLLLHLVMTGDVHVLPAPPARFVRWLARLDDGGVLAFTDPRRLGHVHVVTDDSPFFAGLGPEPLSAAFSVDVFAQALHTRRAIKAVLLDQAVVAGLGNLWADEALHHAGVDPRRPAADLGADDVARLHESIRATLVLAIHEARTELIWRHQSRAAPSPFVVYDRAGAPCLACGAALSSTTIAGRTAVWCPRCQR